MSNDFDPHNVKVVYKSLVKNDSPDGKQSRYDLLYQMALISQKARKDLHSQQIEEQKQKEQSQCTFKPDVQLNYQSTKSEYQLSFLDRQRKWNEDRMSRIESKRKGKVDVNEGECTFKPDLTKQINGKSFDKQEEPLQMSQNQNESYSSFLKRQEEGRKQRQIKAEQKENPFAHLSSEKRKLYPIASKQSDISNFNAETFLGDSESPIKATDSPNKSTPQKNSAEKISLGNAMKILHNELHNIQFGSEFNE